MGEAPVDHKGLTALNEKKFRPPPLTAEKVAALVPLSTSAVAGSPRPGYPRKGDAVFFGSSGELSSGAGNSPDVALGSGRRGVSSSIRYLYSGNFLR